AIERNAIAWLELQRGAQAVRIDIALALLDGYRRSLRRVLRHERLTLAVALLTLLVTAVLYVEVPKGFFPQQDTGVIMGVAEANADISFAAMRARMAALSEVIQRDPDVANVYYWIGPNPTLSQGRVMINLKPYEQRAAKADQ
ncbi:efflux RND transporter permease subunit, partial [Pseudomonas aeruginosa]|uniref:efflux RND transporter permease subunit n=1 Tax=Pseudomonas aeruginosa TaxID=287 RepID=UPI00396F6976